MFRNRTLTQYEVRKLSAIQDIENVRWKIFKRTPFCMVEVESSDEDIFISIAKEILFVTGNPPPEFGLTSSPRSGGRYIVYETGIFRPIFEFSPLPTSTEKAND